MNSCFCFFLMKRSCNESLKLIMETHIAYVGYVGFSVKKKSLGISNYIAFPRTE